ncbi:MAG: hypothetical protein ACR2OZ_16420 [Verrucomicrobiales bacterium]
MSKFLTGKGRQCGTVAAALALVSFDQTQAAINYTTPGSLYSENFDGLPTDAPNNAALQPAPYTNGWQDDTTTVAGDHVSVAGWYLYHPLIPTGAEIGSNGHQRLRMGNGSNTGGFWAFSNTNPANTEKALGEIGSNTVADPAAVNPAERNLYLALRLTNNTGATLDNFTLTFDGEQWRDGQATTGETLSFDYSTTATTVDWFSTAAFTAVPALNFTSPVVAGISTTGTAVDGNVAGRVEDISATVSGVAWAPGTDLWLRWSDPNGAGADDGLAVDDVRFSAAVPEPAGVVLFALGAVSLLGRRPPRP